MTIAQNILQVKNNIAHAAAQSGRDGKDITLIAVTKTIAAADICEAVRCGITDVGENRSQELMAKISQLPLDLSIHFIGQLQNNKVKYVISRVAAVHSLDRLSLAKELQRQCEKANTSINVFVQVNIGNESTKAGISQEELPAFVSALQPFDALHVQGLMTVAPIAPEEVLRPLFLQMRNWNTRMEQLGFEHMPFHQLSMGMSGDYQTAIACGATMVRVGTAIFGAR